MEVEGTSPDGIIRYGARIGQCETLGPGRRAVFWTFGCCFSCPGCIGEEFKTGAWRETSPAEMAAWYLQQKADGLTISGGEPMLQAGALSETIERIRDAQDCGVIVYTGFVYEKLLEKSAADTDIRRFLSQIDLLIDGPYVRELDKNQPYRGSENQRFLPLTDRYRTALESYYASAQERRIEFRLSERETLMAGVPGREQAEIWKKIKKLGEKHVK